MIANDEDDPVGTARCRTVSVPADSHLSPSSIRDERLGIAERVVDRVMIVLGPPRSLPLLRAAEVADQASVEVGDTPAGVPERVLAEVAPEAKVYPLEVIGRVPNLVEKEKWRNLLLTQTDRR